MFKSLKLGFAPACAVALALAGQAAADPWADSGTHVLPPSPPNDDCLVAGGDCDTTGDTTLNATNVEDVFGQPTSANDPNDSVSLGYDQTTTAGGVLTVNFDDNICFNDPLEPDVLVYEYVSEAEDFSARTGMAGQLVNSSKIFLNLAGGVTTYGVDLNGISNQIELTATASNANNLAGPDIAGVFCQSSLDFADIVKEFATSASADGNDTGFDDDIFTGIDAQQHKAFTIEITNNTGIDFAFDGLTFLDVVPAEFDVVSAVSNDFACTVSASELTNNSNSGKEQLKPDFITIDAGGLKDQEACIITVEVVTDLKKGGTRPGRGSSPEYTPTSCPDGGVVLNDGVRIIDDATGATIFHDDDTLALACAADPV